MIYTSYMGNLKNVPEHIKKVSIMRFTPEWSKPYIDDSDTKLAPLESTLLRFKDGTIDKDQYIKEFKEVLSKIKPQTLKRKYKDTVLLCTCKLGKFCHRHLIADYLKENNVEVRELPIKDSLKSIKVEVVDWLSVKECKKNPDKIYVFGDNTIRKGKKGQAVIRDCPNSFGIATKRFPSMRYGSFFNDSKEDKEIVMKDLLALRDLSYNGHTIVFPKDGLGLGLANMGLHSPFLHIRLHTFIEENFMKFVKSDSDRPIICISGSRTITDYDYIKENIDKYIEDNDLYNPIIYTGDARGVDKLGNKYARENDLKLVRCKADWDKHGKSAGYIRNSEMADIADHVLVFWDKKSKGAKHMIDISKKKKKKVKVYKT